MTSFFPFGFNLWLFIVVIIVDVQSFGGNFDEDSLSTNNQKCTTLMHDGLLYDLSSLSRENYWLHSEALHTLDENKETQNRTFYLSICHPIIGKPNCGSDVGVCFFDPSQNSSNTTFNAGTNSKPSVTQEGLIEVSFENGQLCETPKGRGDIYYSTKLYLQCPSSKGDIDSESGRPVLLFSKNPCSFMFIWTTFAACPKRVVSNEGCIIKLENSEYPINLHALSASSYYNVTGRGSTFEINICEPIVNGTCPGKNVLVCDITKKDNPRVISSLDDFSYSTNLTNGLIYHSENVEVLLFCDRSQFTPIIRYFNKTDAKHVFSVKSVNLCSPKEADCLFEDYNLQSYDLRPLHKKKNNWEVIVRENGQQSLFHLNVCGPINKSNGTRCPEGPIGVCQTGLVPGSARNHGYITSHPVVNSDGSITLLYTGGDSCREGVPTSSSRINFICDSNDFNPIFVEVTDSCEYVFLWKTRSACPQNVVQGEDCFVIDPLYGNLYDLNPLRNRNTDYKVNSGDEEFLLNICGPLVNPCKGVDEEKNAGICLVGEKNMSGGSTPAQLVFNDGTLSMKFTNGSIGCGSSRWQSQVLLLCSHEDIGYQGPQYLHSDTNECTHYFIWYTQHACPPHTDVNCVVTVGDKFYDLTPLSNPKFNQIFISNNTRKFILNVCRSVVHSKESRCSYDAASCLIDMSRKNETISLGKVIGPPKYDRGSLKLRYTDGDLCNATHNYETLIKFICSTEEYRSYPNFIGEESCLFLFEWPTSHACAQRIAATSQGNCTAVNTHTNHQFDMNSLFKDKPYEIPINNDNILLINLCGEVQDPRCKSGLGACVVGRRQNSSSNAGLANKNLQFLQWNTFLEYTDGDKCKNGFKRSTKIIFVCKDELATAGPILIGNDGDACTFFINWYTEEACERHISCLASSWERVIDLTPLVRMGEDYVVKDPSNPSLKYLINVCRPVNSTKCHPGSSVCMVDSSPTHGSNPLNLGYPIIPPTITGDQNVSLMYTYGSPCPSHPEQSLSSKIFFQCEEDAGLGQPTFFRKTHDCQVQFEWKTSLVCKKEIFNSGQCTISFEAAKANLELRPLYRPDGYKVNYNNKTFLLNVCGSVCHHSGVCTENRQENFGLSHNSHLKWENGLLLLEYYSGDTCNEALSSYKTSKIYFECDMNAGYGEPTPDDVMDDTRCMAVFKWSTNVTCMKAIYNPPTLPHSSQTVPSPSDVTTTPSSSSSVSSTAVADTSPSSRGSIVIGIIILLAALVALVFFLARDGVIRRAFNRVRFFSKKGYQKAFSSSENDNLLGGKNSYVYKVDEDEEVLRV